MLHIPLGREQILTGTPEQFARLAIYLQECTAAVPDRTHLVRLQLWDGQVVPARYATPNSRRSPAHSPPT